MKTQRDPLEECLRENEALRRRLAEAEQTLEAIRNGEVDALMIAGPDGDRVYTLQGAETPYRFLVEEMNEGALLLGPEGTIRYANSRFAQWAGLPLEQVIGATWDRFFISQERQQLKALLSAAQEAPIRKELHLGSSGRASRPVGLSVRWMEREGISGLLAVVTDLSQRKAAEDALRESERRHRGFFELGAVGMAYTSPEGRFLHVNDNYCELTGYTREELTGMAVLDLTHPEDRQRDRKDLEEYFAGCCPDQECVSEKRYVRRDGTTRWVSVTARMIHKSDGRPLYSIGIIQDITNRKKADEALRQSEARLRQALGAAFAGVWDWDIPSNTITWSPENYELYGLHPTQTAPTYADWERNVHPEDLPGITQALQDALEGRQAEYRVEFRVRHPQKGERWILGVGRVEHGRDGTSLRMSGLNIDITDRKLAEDALRGSEQRFRHLSEYSPDLIALHDLQLRHLYVNPSIAQIVGQPQEAFLGRRIEDMGLPAEAALRIEHALRRTLETNTEFQDELTFPTPEGPRYLLWRSVPLRGATGETQAILAISTDITVRKQGEEALLHARDELARMNSNLESLVRKRAAELEESNRRLREENDRRKILERTLLAAVDQERQRLGRDLHDGLCQTLTGAKFRVGLLQRHLAKKGTAEPAQAVTLEHEINRALEQARTVAYGLNPVRLVARGLMSALEELAGSVRVDSQMTCVCECSSEAAITDQDVAQHLYRIAQEACQNAVKHSQARAVCIQFEDLGDRICLKVCDDGVGFLPDSQQTAGMGLRNMKARAELIGGSLSIEPGQRGGTVVSCTLARPKEGPNPSPVGTATGPHEQPSQRG